MPESPLELVAIGKDLFAGLRHLTAQDRVIVATTVIGLALGEFPERRHAELYDAACDTIAAAVRRAAEHGVSP